MEERESIDSDGILQRLKLPARDVLFQVDLLAPLDLHLLSSSGSLRGGVHLRATLLDHAVHHGKEPGVDTPPHTLVDGNPLLVVGEGEERTGTQHIADASGANNVPVDQRLPSLAEGGLDQAERLRRNHQPQDVTDRAVVGASRVHRKNPAHNVSDQLVHGHSRLGNQRNVTHYYLSWYAFPLGLLY